MGGRAGEASLTVARLELQLGCGQLVYLFCLLGRRGERSFGMGYGSEARPGPGIIWRDCQGYAKKLAMLRDIAVLGVDVSVLAEGCGKSAASAVTLTIAVPEVEIETVVDVCVFVD